MWTDFLLLLLPVLLLVIIFYLTILTYGMSFLLVYFVLPMFYAIDKRTRYDVNGIGKRRVSFLDGYKSFFQSNKGGIFGVSVTILIALLLCFLCTILVGIAIPQIVSCFPDSLSTYHSLVEMLSNPRTTQIALMEFLLENLGQLVQPMTIYVGLVFFFPLFYIIFFGVDENLVHHYISSILFPDLDLNISSSQSRSVAKSFTRGFSRYRLAETMRLNWPFYLLFAGFYALSLWGTSHIQVTNSSYVALVILIVPSAALVYGTYLNHFCLINAYVVVEENQDKILEEMPLAVRTSIYQTFHAKEYIHGEESEMRGCFIKNVGYHVDDKTEENSPKGVVIDFSKEVGKDKGEGHL